MWHYAEPLLLGGLLLILLFFLYYPALNGPFLFDDTNNIEQNKRIQITDLSLASLKKAVEQSRPVATLSFALNYYFTGLSPVGFRITNVLIHVCTAMLLYFVLCYTVLLFPEQDIRHYRWLPAVTAILWAVHPLQIQSVTYIVQRMNSLAAFFYLLTLLLYIRARLSAYVGSKVILSVCCLVTTILAIGSKPNAAVLPVTVFLYEWFFFAKLSWKRLQKYIPLWAVTLLVTAGFVSYFLRGHPLATLHHWDTAFEFTCSQRLMTEFRVVMLYLSLFVLPLPSRLNIDHDIVLSTSLLTPPATLLCLVLIVGMLLSAALTARRLPLFAFGIFWFFLNLLIESTVVPLDFIFEHRTYLPNMMLTAGLVFLVMRLVQWRYLRIAAFIAILSLLSVWTYQRNTAWRSGIALWGDTVRKTPGQARPHESYAYYLEQAGRYPEALKHYKRALQITPGDANTHNNLGNLYARTGRPGAAVEQYKIAVKIQPDYQQAKINIEKVMAWQGKGSKIVNTYRKRLEENPQDIESLRALGDLLVFRRQIPEALQLYGKILAIEPDNGEVLYNRSVLLLRTGRLAEAEQELEKVVLLKPDLAVAHNNLGVVRENLGKFLAARQSYHQALRIDPDFKDARQNLKRLAR
jgi:tetratricopeptide (TPR) repeat protein